mmetsp:Transcript_23753/g.66457  ORF Transcript_23753/g.66457 Transcript_23753/m.66457 type:complete len:465 (-) Transcript_23753:87-1481(-)
MPGARADVAAERAAGPLVEPPRRRGMRRLGAAGAARRGPRARDAPARRPAGGPRGCPAPGRGGLGSRRRPVPRPAAPARGQAQDGRPRAGGAAGVLRPGAGGPRRRRRGARGRARRPGRRGAAPCHGRCRMSRGAARFRGCRPRHRSRVRAGAARPRAQPHPLAARQLRGAEDGGGPGAWAGGLRRARAARLRRRDGTTPIRLPGGHPAHRALRGHARQRGEGCARRGAAGGGGRPLPPRARASRDQGHRGTRPPRAAAEGARLPLRRGRRQSPEPLPLLRRRGCPGHLRGRARGALGPRAGRKHAGERDLAVPGPLRLQRPARPAEAPRRRFPEGPRGARHGSPPPAAEPGRPAPAEGRGAAGLRSGLPPWPGSAWQLGARAPCPLPAPLPMTRERCQCPPCPGRVQQRRRPSAATQRQACSLGLVVAQTGRVPASISKSCGTLVWRRADGPRHWTRRRTQAW